MKMKTYLLDLISKDIQENEQTIKKYKTIIRNIPEQINPKARDMQKRITQLHNKINMARNHQNLLLNLIEDNESHKAELQHLILSIINCEFCEVIPKWKNKANDLLKQK
ncbi:MAG: hypothetical protein WC756_12135 [Taibaiella sp.]|jgi:hypothetical protein